MNFYNLLGATIAYPFRRWPAEGRFQEIVQLQDEREVDQVVCRLAEIIGARTNLPAGAVDNLQILTAELIENVFHHARSEVGAFVCAQCYPKCRIVEIGIADCGRGIRASLLDNSELREKCDTETAAIRLALQRKVTGRPANNSGWGLTWASAFTRENRGCMLIYSRDGVFRVEVDADEDSAVSATVWPGTVVGFQVNMDRQVDLGEIMRRVDPQETQYDELFGE